MMLFVLSILLLSKVQCEDMIKQCVCDDFYPCYRSYDSSIMPCADKCKSTLDEMGDYEQMRKCVDDRRDDIDLTRKCVEAQLGKVYVIEYIIFCKLIIDKLPEYY